jgi:hypothetical protein
MQINIISAVQNQLHMTVEPKNENYCLLECEAM